MNKNDSRDIGSRCIGNIPAENGESIHLAAEGTGFNVVTRDNAQDNRGRSMPGHISVWTNEPLDRDHGLFWREYKRLRDSQ